MAETDDNVKDTNVSESAEDTSAEETSQESVEYWRNKFFKTQRLLEKEKGAKAPDSKQPEVLQTPTTSREETELFLLEDKGYDDDDIETVKSIAKGKGLTLLKATKDPLFKLYMEKKESERKREEAQLGASKGNSVNRAEQGIRPGMTEDEHKKLWRKAVGK